MQDADTPQSGETANVPLSRCPPLSYRRRPWLILWILYLSLTIYGSLIPLTFQSVPFSQAIARFRDVPALPMAIESRSDLVANFLLFVPLTFLAMAMLGRPRGPWWNVIIGLGMIVAGGVLSVAVEFLQIYFPPRTVSQNDVLAEAVGGLAGVLLWFGVGGRFVGWCTTVWTERTRHRKAARILGGYVVFLVLYQFFPFDLTISPAEVYHQFKESKIILVPFYDAGGVAAYTALSKIAVMIPIGFLLMLVQRSETGPSIIRAVVLGCLFAAGIEFGQLFAYSRYTSSTDIIWGTIGAWLGAGLTRHFGPIASAPMVETQFWRRYGIWLKITAVIVWLAGLVWQKWNPFDFTWPEAGLSGAAKEILALPFVRQYFMSEFQAAAQCVREFTTFCVLGLLLRSLAGPRSDAARTVCAVSAAALALLLESGQGFLPTRIADLTSLTVSGIGGVVGALLYEGFVGAFVESGRPGQAAEGEA